MRVYRRLATEIYYNTLFPVYFRDNKWYAQDNETESKEQPTTSTIIETRNDFEQISITVEKSGGATVSLLIEPNHYYRLDGYDAETGLANWVEIPTETGTIAVFDIMEATYTGQDMGKRMISATIKYPTPIDFRIGDYVEMPMQSLRRNPGQSTGSVMAPAERFYIYTEPQCKKTARAMSTGDAFETTVVFYPRQYELAGIQMRDFIQQGANDAKIIYTGFDTVTFYGGAKELLDRCMACLQQQFHDKNGNPLWKYVLAPSLNEQENNALERYAFSFSGNSVMEALMKLNDKDYINTTFFINERTIYVGYKRPFLCAVNSAGSIIDHPLELKYGKTSHLDIDKTYGGLYDITKSVSDEIPITRLYAYGASRNLNRYYCADRIQSGRFVNKLMLPSFSDDGVTDFIESPKGIQKYGVHEGSKTFEEIYPSLRYMTYADIRGTKYCIKVKTSGLDSDKFVDGIMEHTNDILRSKVPLARVQCYKVTPCTGETDPQTNEVDGTLGVNKLVECAPPEDLAVFIHALGKTVKVLLMSDDGVAPSDPNIPRSVERQLAHDFGHVPTHTYNGTDYIEGSCFCVHDIGFADMDGTRYDVTHRQSWFNADFRRISDTDSIFADSKEQQEAELHRIEYVDTFWLTDLYVMEYENGVAQYDNQRYFKRDGYSAWAWPRFNNQSIYPDSLPVNEVVAVEPIVIADTSDNISGGRQQHWDIYLRDVGFAIDEQNDFGEMVFVFSTPVVSILDGTLAGREFTIDGGENLNDFQDRVICAYNEDGSFNRDFLFPGDSGNESVPANALLKGAMWRIRLNRNDNDSELSSIGLVLPNTDIAMRAGDHIVLLDIYMPDIYIRAAEQRLQREAQWFLEKNDTNNVKYSITFDKVRLNQIQAYSKQMREGVMLRMVDNDLNITSENTIRKIVDHAIPSETEVPLYYMHSVTHENELQHTSYSYYKDNDERMPKFSDVARFEPMGEERVGYIKVSIYVPKLNSISTYAYDKDDPDYATGFRIREGVLRPQIEFDHFICNDLIDRYYIEFQCDRSSLSVLTPSGLNMLIGIDEKVTWSEAVKVYYNENDILPAISRDYVRFKAGKFYEVIMDVKEYSYADKNYYFRPTGTHGSGTNVENNDQIFLSTSPEDLQSRHKVDDYTCTSIQYLGNDTKRYKYSFYLPDSFNEDVGYYISLLYFAPDNSGNKKTDFSSIQLVSVTEKDIDAQGNLVNYVDFLVSNVTIKITDNTRPASIKGYADDMRERAIDVVPEPIYEISAQIEEQTKASTWGTLMNDMEKVKTETEQNSRFYESLMQTARNNYQNLLALKNNIFDPDGTCNETFLQVMMLQVGADSMNYQLKYTYTNPIGEPHNFSVGKNPGDTVPHFRVFDDDVLDHFVYTLGADNGGTWEIPGGFDAALTSETQGEGESEETIYPVYYVCIRCRKDTANDMTQDAWMCTKEQYAVNQDQHPTTGAAQYPNGDYYSDFWYFNWGILVPDNAGNYTLMETRGNAYMYGDNIICGKISTLAGNSYFDLTHGNFVLSKDGPDGNNQYHEGLTYINGVLTIYGINDGSENSILTRLGLIEDEEIGGENLYGGEDPLKVEYQRYFPEEYHSKILLSVQNNTKYIGTIQGSDTNISQSDTDYLGRETFLVLASCSVDTIDFVLRYWQWGEVMDVNLSPEEISQVDELCLAVVFCDLEAVKAYSIARQIPLLEVINDIVNGDIKHDFIDQEDENVYWMSISGIQIQKGTKATKYNTYYHHLTEALQGTTKVAGGLVMTNLLMLKDKEGKVIAGMSGLKDNRDSYEQLPENQGWLRPNRGVTLWGGGDYQQALKQAEASALGTLDSLQVLLPILLTKTGIGSRIGCFEVVSNNSAAVYDKARTNRLLFTSGEEISLKMQTKTNGVWTDILIIDTSEIDKKYEIYTMGETLSRRRLKNESDIALTEFFIKFSNEEGDYSEQLSVPVVTTCDLSSNIILMVSSTTSMSSIYLSDVTLYGTVSLVRIENNTRTIIDSVDVVLGSPKIDGNSIDWPGRSLNGFTGNYQNLAAGNYGLLFTIDYFVRTNGFGVSYTEHMYNDNWKDCTIAVALVGNIHFSKSPEDDDRQIMKIGRNGILIARNATSYFMVKNNGNDMDIQIAGIPNSSDQSRPNSLYRIGNDLFIN